MDMKISKKAQLRMAVSDLLVLNISAPFLLGSLQALYANFSILDPTSFIDNNDAVLATEVVERDDEL